MTNPKPFSITPVYDVLLRGTAEMPVGLYHLHLATPDQLCRLHYSPGSITTIKARLKTLADNGYVQADCLPTKRFKSPYYYTLGSKAARYLVAVGMDVSEAFRASRELDKHGLFIQHTLELNDVLIAAALIGRVQSTFTLDSFIHERVLKRTVKSSHGVIPDAFLDFRVSLPDGRRMRMAVLLEHDRGTEEQSYFRKRIRGYINLLKSGAYQEVFQTKVVTVAFTTLVGPERVQQMRAWTLQELTATNEPQTLGLLFLFTALTQPITPSIWLEPQWLTPFIDRGAQALLAF